MIGRTILHYRILEKLGEGGMGVVYRAEDLTLGRHVALKFLPADAAPSDGAHEQVLREARAASAIGHRNVCMIHAVEEHDGRPFIVMELIEGTTLRRRLEAGGALPVRETVALARQVAEALAAAHEHGVLHRDIKPENLMLLADGGLKVLDFGIATLAETLRTTRASTRFKGTPAYMAPERVAGQPAGGRSDLYSLGAVLYESLAGRPVFRADSEAAMLYAILNQVPRPIALLRPDVPPALADLVERLLERDPARRFAGAGPVVAALAGIEADLARAGALPGTGRWTRAWRRVAWRTGSWARRHRMASATALAAAAAAVAIWIMTPRPSPGPRSPQEVRSLAALPCEVVGTDADAYLSDAVPAMMTGYLSDIPGVGTKLPPRKADFERVGGDLGRAARAMDVAAFVTSTVTLQGDRFNLRVHLVDAGTRHILWSRAFDGSRQAVLAVVEQAGRAVRQALRPGAGGALPSRGVVYAPEAELAFREAKFFAHRYEWRVQDADWSLAMKGFERALALDSACAEAAAWIAQLHWTRFERGQAPADSVSGEVERWSRRALDIDPRCGLAHANLGLVAGVLTSPPDVAAALRHGLMGATLSPGNTICLWVLSNAVTHVSLALREEVLRESWSTEPLDIVAGSNLVEALTFQGRFGASLEAAERVALIEPRSLTWFRAGWAECLAGDAAGADSALRICEEIARKSPVPPLWMEHVRLMHGAAFGDTAALEEAIAWAVRIARGPVGSHWTGPLYATLLTPLFVQRGRIEESFDILERLTPALPGGVSDFLEGQPGFARIRSDPRFSALLTRGHETARHYLPVVLEARERGEVPAFLLPRLDEVKRRLGA